MIPDTQALELSGYCHRAAWLVRLNSSRTGGAQEGSLSDTHYDGITTGGAGLTDTQHLFGALYEELHRLARRELRRATSTPW